MRRYISCTGRLRARASTTASPQIAPECSAQLMPSPIMLRKPAAWPVISTLPLPNT